MIEPGDVDYLTSLEGRSACEQALSLEGTELAKLERLRSHCTPAQASAVVKTLRFRRNASTRFEKADEMLFTDEGLQQATSWPVARYRAQRFAGLETVLDLCCGIGGDTIELAKVCEKVIAVDVNPANVRVAQHNVAVHGLAHKVEFRVADVSAGDFLAGLGCRADAVFIDPSRRVNGRRRLSLDDCSPPRDVVLRLVRNVGRAAVKCAPAMDYDEFSADGASVEVISLDRECKEVLLWFGDLAGEADVSATVLPEHARLVKDRSSVAQVKPPGRYIFEPDPAVIRAHLIDELAAKFGLWKIDETIAYLSGDFAVDSPLLRPSRVVSWLPFHLKKLNAALASLGIGRVNIKRRGFPVSPEDLRKKLKLNGDGAATLYCSRHAGKHIIVIGGG